jgi:hypothetical protein
VFLLKEHVMRITSPILALIVCACGGGSGGGSGDGGGEGPLEIVITQIVDSTGISPLVIGDAFIVQGENLDRVAGVTVDGRTATILTQHHDGLTVRVPERIASGTVALVFRNGNRVFRAEVEITREMLVLSRDPSLGIANWHVFMSDGTPSRVIHAHTTASVSAPWQVAYTQSGAVAMLPTGGSVVRLFDLPARTFVQVSTPLSESIAIATDPTNNEALVVGRGGRVAWLSDNDGTWTFRDSRLYPGTELRGCALAAPGVYALLDVTSEELVLLARDETEVARYPVGAFPTQVVAVDGGRGLLVASLRGKAHYYVRSGDDLTRYVAHRDVVANDAIAVTQQGGQAYYLQRNGALLSFHRIDATALQLRGHTTVRRLPAYFCVAVDATRKTAWMGGDRGLTRIELDEGGLPNSQEEKISFPNAGWIFAVAPQP